MAKLQLALVLLLLAIIAVSMASCEVGNAELNGNGSKPKHGRGHGHHKHGHGMGSLRIYQCPGECNRRCSQTQYKKPCLFFCNKCCRTCLCVPPGFYGNKQVCPCYNNWKTETGGPKCP